MIRSTTPGAVTKAVIAGMPQALHPGANPGRLAIMIQWLKTWLAQQRCDHEFKYSRTKPGSLVCKKCRARKPKPR